jgi:hypothetical protein
MKRQDVVLIRQLQLINKLSGHSLVNTVLKDSAAGFEYAAQFNKLLLSMDSMKNKIAAMHEVYADKISFCNNIFLNADDVNELDSNMEPIAKFLPVPINAKKNPTRVEPFPKLNT